MATGTVAAKRLRGEIVDRGDGRRSDVADEVTGFDTGDQRCGSVSEWIPIQQQIEDDVCIEE